MIGERFMAGGLFIAAAMMFVAFAGMAIGVWWEPSLPWIGALPLSAIGLAGAAFFFGVAATLMEDWR